MKTKDVDMDKAYLTKIGDELVRVVLLHRTVNGAGRPAFIVARCDNNKQLPKSRTAAALREIAK